MIGTESNCEAITKEDQGKCWQLPEKSVSTGERPGRLGIVPGSDGSLEQSCRYTCLHVGIQMWNSCRPDFLDNLIAIAALPPKGTCCAPQELYSTNTILRNAAAARPLLLPTLIPPPPCVSRSPPSPHPRKASGCYFSLGSAPQLRPDSVYFQPHAFASTIRPRKMNATAV